MWRKWAGDSRVTVLTVATGTSARIEQIRAEDGLGVPIAWAPEGWTDTVGIRAFPETIFLDPQGRVAARITEGTDQAQLDARIVALMAEAQGETLDYAARVEHRHSLSSRFFFALEELLPHPGPEALDPFTWSVRRRGDEVILRLDVPRHTHVNRDQVEVVWVDNQGERPLPLPPGEVSVEPGIGEIERYSSDLVLRVPAGSGPARVRLRHQGCRDELCYPPATAERSIPLR